MAFISSSNTSSGKSKVPSIQEASTASAQVPTVSTDIDDDDIEGMDIKRNLALLSIRTDRESYKKDPKVEEPSPKAMIAIDGIGWDWSYMAEEDEASKNHALVANEKEVPTEYALMAKSSSSSDNEGIPQDNINDKGYLDSGCSRHMTGNISYLFEYEPFNGGYVSFGHGRGKITGKGSIKTGTSFTNILGTREDVHQAVKEKESPLRFIALPNCRNSNPTTSTKVSNNDSFELASSSTVETEVLTINTPILTYSLFVPPVTSNVPTIISRGGSSFLEPLSLGNAMSFEKRLEDFFGDTSNAVSLNEVEADLSNMETTIQEEGIDYEEVFTPVARIEAIRLFLAYASYMGFTVYQMDFKSVFLYGNINDEVYVMQPPGFQDPKFPHRVYKVEKAMYGLHQASRALYGTLSKYLLDNGFQRGTIDQTLFIRKLKEESLLVQVYVDDIIFGSSNPKLCRQFEALMHDKFQMSVMGELKFFLGLQVLQKKDGIFLSQDKYVGDILKKFGYTDIRAAKTPMDSWGKGTSRIRVFIKYSWPVLDCPYWVETTNGETKILAKLNGRQRTVSELSIRRHLKLNDEEDETAFPTRDVRYGKAFPTYTSLDAGQDRENIAKTSAMPHEALPKVTSLGDGNSLMEERIQSQDLKITQLNTRVKTLEDNEKRRGERDLQSACVPAFADVDHAGCQDTRQSTSGSVQFLGERLLSWSSKQKKSAAISSTEAEYIALSGCCAQILWMRSQLSDYGLVFNKIPMYCDNKSAIALCCNNVQHSRTMATTIDQQTALDESLVPSTQRNMATTIKQQTALDESLVPSTQRLRILRSNFRLPSDIQRKEATLQVIYDVLRNSPLFRAFQVTTDATAKLHHNSIRFKIDTRKSVLDLEAFREMLHISPRIPNQPFADLPTEEEILDFLRFLGHSHDIRYLTDVNVNKLYQPWRSFASVINKCLTGKSSGVDSFRLSQAQMLWGFYHGINIDFAYLIWEDFGIRKPSISRRNRIHWHYVRDDALFSTIKVVSRHQTTQQYGVILPIELTTTEIRNSKAYKEYHACAMGEAAPKPKASARKKKDVQRTEAEQLKIVLKRSRQETHISQQSGSDTDEGTGSKPGVPDVPSDDSEEELSSKSSDDEDVGSHEEGKNSDESDDDRDEGSDNDSDETVKSGAGKDDDDDDDEDDDDNDEEEEIAKDDEEGKETSKGGNEVRESEGESDEEETREEEDENFDSIPRTSKESEEESNDEEEQESRLSEQARIQEEEDADELYRDVNINQGRGLQVTQNVEDT
nr:putative ribonuclease H-like domain-containing protein [Tanacetum cinerariifolium]